MGVYELLLNHVSGWLKDRSGKKRERSRQIFQPIFEQFQTAIVEVRNIQRPDALDREWWKRLKLSAGAELIELGLRNQIANVYENLAPRYDEAFLEVNGTAVPMLMRRLAEHFGTLRQYSPSYSLPKWWRFLSEDNVKRSALDLPNLNDIQLWDLLFLDISKLPPGQTAEQFLTMCWDEAVEMPEFRDLKEARRNLSREMSWALDGIRKHIVH